MAWLKAAEPDDRRAPGGLAENASDDLLQAAVENPDHSEAGRAQAGAHLAARGLARRPWRLRVPGFFTAADLEKHGGRLFFGWGRALRRWTGWGVYLTLAGLFVLVGFAVNAEDAGDLARAAHLQRIGEGIGAAWGLLLLVWLAASAFRRKPARVLLLRKFNVRAIGDALSRMIAHELRPYGHVASLADKHIRRSRFGWLSMALMAPGNPLAAAWLLIGAPVRFIYRLFDRSAMGPAVVLNARDYRNLARRLRDRIGLNLQVATISKEAFLVRTSDAWWKLVVRLLLDSSDVIVVDLSQVAEGTEWELAQIAAEAMAPRCVFVSVWGQEAAARAALARFDIIAPLHLYAPDGAMLKRAAFRAAMLGAMRATHGLAP